MKLSESEQKFLRRCGISEKMDFKTAEPLVLKIVYDYLGKVGKNRASDVISSALQLYERNGDFKALQDVVFKTLTDLEGYAKKVRDPNPLLGKNVEALKGLMADLNNNGVTESKVKGKKVKAIRENRWEDDDNVMTRDPGVITHNKPQVKKPSLYKVIILNDDFTPFEFVIDLVQRFFNKSEQEALQITMDVDRKGAGLCGVYTHEVAETKVAQVMDYCRKNQHPLQCIMEKE